jgi:hypothetical protein
MLSAHEARQLSEQAQAGQFDRMMSVIDKAVYQATVQGDQEAHVTGPHDSRVLQEVSKLGYNVVYFKDSISGLTGQFALGSGHYRILW